MHSKYSRKNKNFGTTTRRKQGKTEGESFAGNDGETTNLVPTCKNNLPDWIPAPDCDAGQVFAGMTKKDGNDEDEALALLSEKI